MKLEVGEFYLSAGGEIVEINFFNKFSMFEDINCNTYLENGKCNGDCREFDLIAHIPKELHYKICDLINDYHTIPIIRDSINNIYKKKTTIPD